MAEAGLDIDSKEGKLEIPPREDYLVLLHLKHQALLIQEAVFPPCSGGESGTYAGSDLSSPFPSAQELLAVTLTLGRGHH